jgi:site-specific recombinase XerD
MDYETALQLFTAYLERRASDRSTPVHYLSDIRLFFACVGIKTPLAVTARDVDQFVAAQREQGLSAATINRRLAALRVFFECLAAEAPDQPWPNPVHWRRHRARQGLRLPRDASDAAVAQLFATISDPRDTAVFGLMVGAGLRVGEVATLRLEDLTAPAQPTALARLRVCGKGRKERLVWLTPTYYAQVTAWLAVRPASASPHLFLSQRGQGLSVDGIQARLAHYCGLAGLTLTCHQLRHTFARRLAEEQMPIEGIAKLLGHAQVTTTERYTAGADPDLRAAFERAMAAAPAPLHPPAAPVALPAVPAPRPVAPADPAALTAALQRLAALPAWLQDVLTAYVRRQWFTWKPHLAAEHADRLTRQLGRLWAWLLAYRPLGGWADLQRSDLEAWLTARQTAGIAIATQRHELATLLAVLHYAADQDRPVAANLFRIAYPAAPTPLPRHLSEAEFERLAATVLAQTAGDSPTARQEQAWFLTLTHTGLRINELLDLRLSDLDLAGRRLLIRQAKNGADRLVYLTPPVVTALQRHLAVRPASADDHLWLQAGQPLTANQVRYRLHGWGQACAVAVSPHRLRHTFATRLVNHGLPLEAVRKLLGHTTLHMTQHYARLYDTTVQRQFEAAMTEIAALALAQPTTAATRPLVTT